MKRLAYIFNNIDLFFATLFSCLMMVLLMLQVVSRYVFNHALPWTEELALVSFVLSIYFGASVAVLKKKHLRVEIVLSKFSPRNRNLIEIFDNVVFFIFNIIITFGLYDVTRNLWIYKNKLAITRLPTWIPYAAVPCILMLLNVRLIQDTINIVKDLKNGSVLQAAMNVKVDEVDENLIDLSGEETNNIEQNDRKEIN